MTEAGGVAHALVVTALAELTYRTRWRNAGIDEIHTYAWVHRELEKGRRLVFDRHNPTH